MRMPSHNGWWRGSMTPRPWLDFLAAAKRHRDINAVSCSAARKGNGGDKPAQDHETRSVVNPIKQCPNI